VSCQRRARRDLRFACLNPVSRHKGADALGRLSPVPLAVRRSRRAAKRVSRRCVRYTASESTHSGRPAPPKTANSRPENNSRVRTSIPYPNPNRARQESTAGWLRILKVTDRHLTGFKHFHCEPEQTNHPPPKRKNKRNCKIENSACPFLSGVNPTPRTLLCPKFLVPRFLPRRCLSMLNQKRLIQRHKPVPVLRSKSTHPSFPATRCKMPGSSDRWWPTSHCRLIGRQRRHRFRSCFGL